MLNYTNLTMGKLVEEVSFRATKFRAEYNLDYYTIALMANHAIYEIMSKSLPYKDWAYVTNIPVADGTLLPREFIKPIRVMLNEQGNNNVEARYATPMEVYQTTDNLYGIGYNLAYNIQPTYTLWGERDNGVPYNPSQLYIYIYPTTRTGAMDCYVAPAFNFAENYSIPIPYEFEESVIISTLFRVLQHLGLSKESSIVFQYLSAERQKAITTLIEKKRTEVTNLDSFALPVPPFAPAQPQPFTTIQRRR